MAGRFIVFEGVDHCGKTTQIDLAEKWLKKRGHRVVRLREPGATEVGEQIRKILLDSKEDIEPKTEALLFMAARYELVHKKIRPAIESGCVVLLDRYYYSTIAYQGGGGKVGFEFVMEFVEFLDLDEPDYVIYLDGDPKRLALRNKGPQDRIEAKGIEYQKKVRKMYRMMARIFNETFYTINAEKKVENVHAEIGQVLSENGF